MIVEYFVFVLLSKLACHRVGLARLRWGVARMPSPRGRWAVSVVQKREAIVSKSKAFLGRGRWYRRLEPRHADIAHPMMAVGLLVSSGRCQPLIANSELLFGLWTRRTRHNDHSATISASNEAHTGLLHLLALGLDHR
jgi:hypothetical protein